jgi:transcriptional regulator with PAS, ATPase and Fis domain
MPLGSHKQHKIDVRIIAATNKNIEKEVAEKRFREDLYYRLNAFDLYVPPLRERREDILPLALHFASENEKHKRLTNNAITVLNSYNWPGNIRELQNTIKRAILMAADGDTISMEHFPKRLQNTTHININIEQGEGIIDQMERMIILQTLEKNNFNRSETAKELKMSRRTLTFKLRRLKEAGYKI